MRIRMKRNIDVLSTRKFHPAVSWALNFLYRLKYFMRFCVAFISKADSSLKDAEFKLAQSGDATCNGLDSAEVKLKWKKKKKLRQRCYAIHLIWFQVGSRIMTLKPTPPVERCYFPSWFIDTKSWTTLSGNNMYRYNQR